MADINIERKSSNTVWWILGILALILLIWLIFGWMATEPAMTSLPADGTPLAAILVPAPAPGA